jgi:uncharacterized membrane protein
MTSLRAGAGVRLPALAALALLLFSLVAPPMPARAQAGLQISTPYPAVSAQPGTTVSFDLTVKADAAARVDLSLEGLPDGWTASFRGGGREVSTVYADPSTPPALALDVNVPDDAADGTTTITVVGTAGDQSARLPIDIAIVVEGGGAVRLTTEFPSQRGTADQTFEFSVNLENDTPQQLTLALNATAPQGWTVEVRPEGEARAASVTIDARGSKRLTVQATPPADVASGQYPLRVDAVSGDLGATLDLAAEVTGKVDMQFTTSDQRLNTTATAGGNQDVDVVIANTGTSPITSIALSGSGPSDWEVTFDPDAVDQLAPGETATATAHIVPSQNAVAGDYVVTLKAGAEGANESMDIRVTVETPPVWTIVGIALIVLTLGGLVWVFRRYGRR